jgi:hypothetical protein
LHRLAQSWDREIFGPAFLQQPRSNSSSSSTESSDGSSVFDIESHLLDHDVKPIYGLLEALGRTYRPISSPEVAVPFPFESVTNHDSTSSRDRRDPLTAVTMASTSDAPLAFLRHNPVMSGLSDVYNAFQERREKLGLSNPGLVENIAKGTSLILQAASCCLRQ